MIQDQINSRIDELGSLVPDRKLKLSIPVAILLQEAEDLYEWCQQDRQALTGAGMDWSIVTDLPVRTGVLRTTQTRWRNEFMGLKECMVQWKRAASEARELRRKIVHQLFHAFHGIPEEYEKVRRINRGSSNADLIQDLTDLAVLGMKNIARLEAVGADAGLLRTAREISTSLSGLLAQVNNSKMETSPALELRNRAYIHLKEAVQEIRRVGQFVFWKNIERQKAYTSMFNRKKKGRRKMPDPQRENESRP